LRWQPLPGVGWLRLVSWAVLAFPLPLLLRWPGWRLVAAAGVLAAADTIAGVGASTAADRSPQAGLVRWLPFTG